MDEASKQALTLFQQLNQQDQHLALDVLQRYAEHSAHGGPVMWMLGLHYTYAEPGRAECYLDVTPALHNTNGIAHGGIAYFLIDSAMGAAFSRALEPPLRCATVELKVNYVRAVHTGRLTAQAEVVEQTKRFGILTSRVVDAEQRLVALAQGTFAVLTPR